MHAREDIFKFETLNFGGLEAGSHRHCVMAALRLTQNAHAELHGLLNAPPTEKEDQAEIMRCKEYLA